MLNEIIKGVSIQLNNTFGDEYRIYQNNVSQGLKGPCFFISVLNPTFSSLVGHRYISRNPLAVQYIPGDGGKKEDLYVVGWKLMEALRYITLPDGAVLRGSNLNFEVIDDVLHCFADYSLTLIIKPTSETAMETLDAVVGTTEG